MRSYQEGALDMTVNFEGQKLVVVGGSSGMGRDTVADLVATPLYERFVPQDKLDETCTASTASTRSAGSAPPATWPTPSPSCSPPPTAG